MPSRIRSARRWSRWVRPTLWLLLGVLAAAIVHASWLRWMDPFVDFGREVYMPWRILSGEHPGRDFVHLYGPLSAYFNAGLFALFGPAIQTIVFANLLVFAVVIAALFAVVRRSFGLMPAFVATAIAIPVFGFPHYSGINNYTYAAPYSHEATHGMMVLLLTLLWLGRRNGSAQPVSSGLVAGIGFGLAALTKTEYVLVAGLLWVACSVRAIREQRAGGWRWFVATFAGGAAVWAVAWVALLTALSVGFASRLVANAVLAPFSYRVLSQSPLGLRLLGADRLGENILGLVLAGGIALAVLAALGWGARKVAGKFGNAGSAMVAIAAVAMAVGASLSLPWLQCGAVFPAMLVGGMTWLLFRPTSPERAPGWTRHRGWNQFLFFVAGTGMLARMAFDPVVNHYGFFQAMLAGTWSVGFLVGEWPRFAGRHGRLRVGLAVAMTVFLGLGALQLWQRSLEYYHKKDMVLGVGGDRLRGYRPDVHGLPQAWEQVRAHLAATTSPTSTLLVVPEGLALNYWTRRKHPLRVLDVLPATLVLNSRDVLADLEAAPPDTVVLVSRDMTEFGYVAYGQDERSGKLLLEWLARTYAVEIRAGEYPFTPGKLGLWVLRRKSP